MIQVCPFCGWRRNSKLAGERKLPEMAVHKQTCYVNPRVIALTNHAQRQAEVENQQREKKAKRWSKRKGKRKMKIDPMLPFRVFQRNPLLVVHIRKAFYGLATLSVLLGAAFVAYRDWQRQQGNEHQDEGEEER
jgi:hypothetical protein